MSRTILFFLFFLLTLLLIISGCAEQECKKPFTKIGSRCCIDLDGNQKCDIDEQEESQDHLVAEDNDAKTASSETLSQLPEIKEPAVKIESKSQITGSATAELKQEPKQEITPNQQITTHAMQNKEETDEEQSSIIIQSSESPSKTQKFLDRYNSMNKGYRYVYKTLMHKVNGNKMKIQLSTPKKYKAIQINGKTHGAFYIDTIYLDKLKLTAKGYCEKHAICYEKEIFDIPLHLDYDEFKEKTPDDWLYEYASVEPNNYEEGKYYVKGRLTTRAIYLLTHGELRIYYDPKVGLPLRIEQQINPYPTEITEYLDLAAELIEPTEVIHKSRKEVSTEDVFYTTRS